MSTLTIMTGPVKRRRFALPAVLGLGLLALAALVFWPATGAAQENRRIEWERYTVSLTVDRTGTLHVLELFDVTFFGTSVYRYGFAELPLESVDAIDSIAVSEITESGTITFTKVPASSFSRNQPNTFMTREQDGHVLVEYAFVPATNVTRTFRLTYRVKGALKIFPDAEPPAELLRWRAIDAQVTVLAPVRQLTVSVLLPEPLSQAEIEFGEDSTANRMTPDESPLLWTWKRPLLRPGEEFVVSMRFPRVTTAPPPAWQQDERRLYLLTVGSVVFALVMLPTGGVLLARNYWRNGRDPHVAPVVNYVTEPPEGLSPGLMGVLHDQRVNDRDLVATIVDLCRRGVLVIEEGRKSSSSIIAERRTYIIRLVGWTDDILPFERDLISALFCSSADGRATTLRDARKSLPKRTNDIRVEMSNELKRRGLIDYSPGDQGAWWVTLAAIFVGVPLVCLPLFAGGAFGRYTALAAIWTVVIVIAGLSLLLLAKALPRRTQRGAELRVRCLAFEEHLHHIVDLIRQDRQHPAAKQFERYLPYAVAFGIERRWVERFALADVPAPRWYIPFRVENNGLSPSLGDRSLQELSDGAFASLSSMSQGLTDFLNDVDVAFDLGTSGSLTGGFSAGPIAGGGGRGFG